MEGVVPLYEEWSAMVDHHYTLEQWQALPNDIKAACIAYARLKILIDLHQQDAIKQAMRRLERARRGQ